MRRAWVAGGCALLIAASGCAADPGRGAAPTTLPPAPTASVTPGAAGTSPSGTPAASTPASGTPAASCVAAVTALTPAQRVGQLFVVGVRGELDAAERRAIADHGAGSVILMGGADAADTTGAVSQVKARVPVLVTVDQEGGTVQRFRGGGFEAIPSARVQAGMSDADLTESWQRWGGQLREAGIHLDFAPVADVVPSSKDATNAPVGKLGRGYGSDPDEVSAKVTAVVRGLDAAGVGSSAKHFPGLGEVVGNTDFTAGVTDTVTTATSDSLRPFAAAVAAGAPSVMVATATYTRLDPDNPAAFSARVLGLLRGPLGFTGVIASDDLGAAEAVAGVQPAQRALRFLRAGGDWVVVVEPGVAVTMMRAVTDAAASDPALARRVDESAARVLALKARLGVASCDAAPR